MAESPRSTFRAALDGVLAAFRKAKSDYDAEGRFSKLRIQILAVLVADVVLAGFVAYASQKTELLIAAWWQVGFPSNLVVVQNSMDSPIKGAIMVLDGRYRSKPVELKVGPNGFEIEKEFVDGKQFAPPKDQAPRSLVIETPEGNISVQLTKKEG